MQRPGGEQVVGDVIGRTARVVTVLAVADLAVVIDHFPEGNHDGAQGFGLQVVIGPPGDADQPLEEVAVGQGPLATALAAEEAERLAGQRRSA